LLSTITERSIQPFSPKRYIAFTGWTVAVWISYNFLIDARQRRDASPKATHVINVIGKLLFAIFICAAVLLFEKFAIQWIAGKFHEKSYAGTRLLFYFIFTTPCSSVWKGNPLFFFFWPERIADQKFAVKSLVTLYKNSVDVPGHIDTLGQNGKGSSVNPKQLFKKLKEGVRFATTTTATVFGNVASEIAGRYGTVWLWPNGLGTEVTPLFILLPALCYSLTPLKPSLKRLSNPQISRAW